MAITKSSSKREVCKGGHNGSLHHYYENITVSRLTDELVQRLSATVDCDIFENAEGQPYLSIFRPYLNQAEGLIHRINAYEEPPEFVIWKEDLPDGLIQALHELGVVMMKRVITEAVRQLYESVSYDYFHTCGIYCKTPWRFGKKKSDH